MADNSWWNSVSTGFSDFADDFGDLFNVGGTISQSSNIKPDDVLKTKSALNAVGRYEVPDFGITDVPDRGMIDGLMDFQANNDLKVDGIMKPGGPTETALGRTLVKQGISASDLLAQTKAQNATPVLDVSKPAQTSWSASVPFSEDAKPKKVPPSKIDPTTGLTGPLASAPKGKMPTKKQWAEVAKRQQQRASTVIPEVGLSAKSHTREEKSKNQEQKEGKKGLLDGEVTPCSKNASMMEAARSGRDGSEHRMRQIKRDQKRDEAALRIVEGEFHMAVAELGLSLATDALSGAWKTILKALVSAGANSLGINKVKQAYTKYGEIRYRLKNYDSNLAPHERDFEIYKKKLTDLYREKKKLGC